MTKPVERREAAPREEPKARLPALPDAGSLETGSEVVELLGREVTARLGVFAVRGAGSVRGPGGAGGSSPADRLACVYLDTPGPETADGVVRVVRSATNGVATFSRSAPGCLVGDTAVRVSLGPCPDDPAASLLEVCAHLDPRHLTHAFLFTGRVSVEEATAFLAAFRSSRDYVLSVAIERQLDFGRLYIVKYHVEVRRRPAGRP
ncbi:MAG: hypothetical protein K6U08_05995 [Firmicutes bacterium]|nr:hypothetical protein [Bacillota bacterium]